MTALGSLRRIAAEQSRDRLLAVGAAASAAWLALVGLFAWLGPDGQPQTASSWLIWLMGVLLPLALIWVAIFSARSLVLLRQEADDLRASLREIRSGAPGPAPAEPPLRAHKTTLLQPHRTAPPKAQSDDRQAAMDLGAPPVPELTPTELFLALNFPDGPEDREAIRCLRLALGDPAMARLIRAAQDVVTLLAGQGVYMDDLEVPETDPHLWRRFAAGARGDEVSGLGVITDPEVLATAGRMLRDDEIFRDVAHHFLRHFDRLLARRAESDEPVVLAVLSESRSGRAFLVLAQASGLLGGQMTREDAASD